MKKFKPLSIDEIDFRIQSINKWGYATILAYKDARVDMNRLDEVYGTGYWQKKFELINGNLFCHVGIWNKELEQWVWVCDVGTESLTEKEKGQASDAFKRACFNLGIGRELYDYPVIQIKLNQDEFKIENYNGKEVVKATFALKLKEWTWISKFNEDDRIETLIAIDTNMNERFVWHEKAQPPVNVGKYTENADIIQRIEKCKTLDELNNLYIELGQQAPKYKGSFTSRKEFLK